MSKVSYEQERATPRAGSLREWKKERQGQGQKQEQIPCGNDNQKGNGKSKGKSKDGSKDRSRFPAGMTTKKGKGNGKRYGGVSFGW